MIYFRTILTSLTIVFIISSCDKEQIVTIEDEDSPFSEIVSLTTNSQINTIILKNYDTQSDGRVTSKFGELLFNKAEIGYSKNSNSIATVVPFGDGISYLVILGNEDGAIHEEFVTSIVTNSDNSSEVNYYDIEGNPTISFSIIDGKIDNLASNSASGRIASWDSCATCAVTSCGADGGCTILCGLTGPWCLTAIAIACIGSELSC